MRFRTLDDMDLAGKRVLVRVDINVPMRDGKVTDDTRIRRIAPTVKEILERGGKPILLSHFGRPKGRRVPELSLQPLVPALEAALGARVVFAADCVGPAAEAAIAAAAPGEVVLLENLRFHPGEEANDPEFARALAALGDIYVNDAFSAAHRAHASTEGLARLLPACAGRLMEAELRALEAALEQPRRPVVAVVGGAKVSTKIGVLRHLVEKVDRLVIGGGMANTFLLARGHEIGLSLAEREMTEVADAILERAAAEGCEVILPEDVVVAWEFAAHARHQTVPAAACPADAMILDAGPRTVARIVACLEASATCVWNGPLGAFELEPFDRATTECARAAARLTQAGRLVSVAGGGDTVAALAHAGVVDRFTYVSTAGGAFLEWMEGKTLPGVAALAV